MNFFSTLPSANDADFFSTGRSWGSLRIDDVIGRLISGICQAMSIEGERGNARDDRRGGVGSLRIDDVIDQLISGICQAKTIEDMCGNARDDRRGGVGFASH